MREGARKGRWGDAGGTFPARGKLRKNIDDVNKVKKGLLAQNYFKEHS